MIIKDLKIETFNSNHPWVFNSIQSKYHLESNSTIWHTRTIA